MKNTEILGLLASIFGLSLAGVAAVLIISYLRPNIDNTLLITTVIGFLTPTLASLIAVIKGFTNASAIQDLHLIVNSRLTQLLQQTALASEAFGRADAAKGIVNASISADNNPSPAPEVLPADKRKDV